MQPSSLVLGGSRFGYFCRENLLHFGQKPQCTRNGGGKSRSGWSASQTGTEVPGDTRWSWNQRNSPARQHRASCPWELQGGRDHLASGTPGHLHTISQQGGWCRPFPPAEPPAYELASETPLLLHLSRLSWLIKEILLFFSHLLWNWTCRLWEALRSEEGVSSVLRNLACTSPVDPVSGRSGLNLCCGGGGQGKPKPVARNEVLMHRNLVFNMP